MSKLAEYRDLIKDLAELLDKSTLSEIEVEEDDFRIRVARELSAPAHQPQGIAPQAVHAALPATQFSLPETPKEHSAVSKETSQVEKAQSQDNRNHPGLVKSPMVGTAYASSNPGSAPFIAVGTAVKEGDTLVIIEAMKVMNQIPSPKSGTVKEVLFTDNEPLEFDQPICIIE